MCVCSLGESVFIGGKGGGIQQEPKDNSGHLTGVVCVCSLGERVGGGFSKSQRTVVVIFQV